MIIFLFFYLIANKPNKSKNNYYYPVSNSNSNSNYASYTLNGNEEDLLDKVQGYENELLMPNNLQEGSYEDQFKDQFKEIDFSKISPPNTQIGFNPEPVDRSEMKLPYANINVNCL